MSNLPKLPSLDDLDSSPFSEQESSPFSEQDSFTESDGPFSDSPFSEPMLTKKQEVKKQNKTTEKNAELARKLEDLKLNFERDDSYTGDEYFSNTFTRDGWIGDINLDYVLSCAIIQGASDVHINVNKPIAFTLHKDIVKQYDFPIPDDDYLTEVVNSILTSAQTADYAKDREFDFTYKIKFGPYVNRRFRTNVGRSFGYNFLVFRTINDVIPPPHELEIPDEIIQWSYQPSGVWIVGGATGSGKALHIDTEIPTPNGLTTMKDLKVGDTVYDKNGKVTNVIDKYSPDSKRFFEITFSDNTKVKAADNHLWEVVENGNRAVVDTEYLFNNLKDKGFYIERPLPVVEPSASMMNNTSVKAKCYTTVENMRMLCASYGWECSPIKEKNGVYSFVYDKNPETHITFEKIEEIDGNKEEYYCISVDSSSKVFLITKSYIPTHNSTTLASVIHNLQLKTKKKIITIEKPIEYLYPEDEGSALIVQRDVGPDTRSFYNGLTYALRQNPDIILIGEVRNREEVEELIRAAETGHLAISTIHTNSVTTTFNRILSLFPAEDGARLKSSTLR